MSQTGPGCPVKDLVYLNPSESEIGRAIALRCRRDQLYGNRFQERKGDMRHLGELAEICLVRHIESLGLEVEHLDEDTAAGKPDLLIEGYPVGVKAVKRKGPILSHYSMQITKAHAHEPVDSFFFCSYEYPLNRLWLVGGISRLRFMREAVFVGEGEAVHSAYRIRPGHSIYNINVMQLIPPRAFLCGFGRARCA